MIAGAAGYETGIGYREKCELNSAMSNRRHTSASRSIQRPVYIDRLGKSIPKRSLQQLHTNRRIWSQMICPDPKCCPPNGTGLLGDARSHAVHARAKGLAQIDGIQEIQWKWNHLAAATAQGISLAERINRLADTDTSLGKVDTSALRAMHKVASVNRYRRALRRSA